MIPYDNSLRRQSYSLPLLLEEQRDDLVRKAAGLMTDIEIHKIQNIILSGCGDSYGAGLALKYPLELLTGLPVDLVAAVDFSACMLPERITSQTLVVPISISGSGVRIREVTEKANRLGALTLGITREKDSDIGNTAERLLELDIQPFERGPGNRNYFVSLLALLHLGIRIGMVRNVHGGKKAEQYLSAIDGQGPELERLLPAMDRALYEWAESHRSLPAFDFVGAGLDYASAWFGHAKMIEAAGNYSMHINSEEWFHMNNFFRNIKECGTLYFAGIKNPAYGRTMEAAAYGARIGRPGILITDGEPEGLAAGTVCVRVPETSFYPASALTQYVPGCILAGYIGAMLEERNCRGCLGPWEFAAGGAFIRNSAAIDGEKGVRSYDG